MGGLYRQPLAAQPDLVALAQAYPEDFPFLLESSAESSLGRYSILLAASDEYLEAQPGKEGQAAFLRELKQWYHRERAPRHPKDSDIPFRGGWFVYMGYEMAGGIEPVLNLPNNPTGLPDALAYRCRGAVIVFHDQHRGRAEVVAEDQATAHEISARIDSCGQSTVSMNPSPGVQALGKVEEGDPEGFMDGVRSIHHYLRAGDVFQVNLSRLWRAKLKEASRPVDVYRALRQSNPAPFSGLMQWKGRSVISSSPERLIELRNGVVQTRPIAGTRPRNADPALDQALSRELIENIKERAEHIMLIDLERNDLGRVCKPGSVEVSELMVVESYAHVHHIVSNVRGMLSEEADPVDALSAVFPGGTITGCPKIRCMEIIAELEKEGRGCYTGSMGYLCRDGDLDMNILIRTMLMEQQQLTFRTGAGIVADSIPENELIETSDKARGLLLAIKG